MKKYRFLLAAAVVAIASVLLNSCGFTNEVDYDRTLLMGHWQEGTLHEVYEDGSGYTWDTADDVTEDEAQHFTWTLEGDNLTQIHIMEMGGEIPKVYTVTNLTETTLSYEDSYGKIHTFARVQK